MKNSVVITVGIVVIVVLGIGGYFLSQRNAQSDSMMKKNEAMTQKDKAMDGGQDEAVKEDDTTMKQDTRKMEDDKMNGSRYVEYSKAALDKAASGRRVLFFYASWCPICRPADTNFKENVGKIPEDLTLVRVNYNDPETDQEEKDLAKKYNVTYQHTFVQIDAHGKEIAKWNGGQINELLSNSK